MKWSVTTALCRWASKSKVKWERCGYMRLARQQFVLKQWGSIIRLPRTKLYNQAIYLARSLLSRVTSTPRSKFLLRKCCEPIDPGLCMHYWNYKPIWLPITHKPFLWILSPIPTHKKLFYRSSITAAGTTLLDEIAFTQAPWFSTCIIGWRLQVLSIQCSLL